MDLSCLGVIRHEPREYGRSALGAPLTVFRTEGPPRYLLVAGQHGDEPETTVVLSHALRTVPVDLLGSAVVLAANPDGLAMGTRGNARGVDLNRNFPASNWLPAPVHYRWYSDGPREVLLSSGGRPGSEPETSALIALIEEIRPEAILAFHAPLGCIEDPLLSPLAGALAARTRMDLVETIGYGTPGSLGSWSEDQKIHTITVELPDESLQELRRRFEPAVGCLLRGERFW